MSDARRKRQQERDGTLEASPQSRKKLIWGGIVVLFVAAWAAGWEYKNHRYDGFAKCLAEKHAKMYGLYWCPHCADQKAMFGKAFQYVPYVECAIKGSTQLTPACTAAGVKLFPSWQFENGKPIEGVFPMQELSDKTGCSFNGSSGVPGPTVDVKREPPQPEDPRAALLRDVKLQYKWRKEGFGSVMMADFTVSNPTQYRFKDFVVRCVHSAPSGTVIDSNTETVYEIVESMSTKAIKPMNMGFIHAQAVRSSCQITDLVVLQ